LKKDESIFLSMGSRMSSYRKIQEEITGRIHTV